MAKVKEYEDILGQVFGDSDSERSQPSSDTILWSGQGEQDGDRTRTGQRTLHQSWPRTHARRLHSINPDSTGRTHLRRNFLWLHAPPFDGVRIAIQQGAMRLIRNVRVRGSSSFLEIPAPATSLAALSVDIIHF
ncbi:uncharacterized protein LOC110183910 [Drosophila serrata]|uniref:uncharacterized protein LOC110183910 n=1 Tax=Drosophila serrata TaxID=7274 RepID=UPI000A1D2D0B|nr:uncharacterized protein LOC110183910 [Drosophila serrata]